jgi:hypothetical protein
MYDAAYDKTLKSCWEMVKISFAKSIYIDIIPLCHPYTSSMIAIIIHLFGKGRMVMANDSTYLVFASCLGEYK